MNTGPGMALHTWLSNILAVPSSSLSETVRANTLLIHTIWSLYPEHTVNEHLYSLKCLCKNISIHIFVKLHGFLHTVNEHLYSLKCLCKNISIHIFVNLHGFYLLQHNLLYIINYHKNIIIFFTWRWLIVKITENSVSVSVFTLRIRIKNGTS